MIGFVELRKVIAGHHVIIRPEGAKEKRWAIGYCHEKEFFVGILGSGQNVIDFVFGVGKVETVNFLHIVWNQG